MTYRPNGLNGNLQTNSQAAQYTFFSVAHRTFWKTDYIIRHKTSLNKHTKTEIPHLLYSIRSQ
jgi:hypothetical protein